MKYKPLEEDSDIILQLLEETDVLDDGIYDICTNVSIQSCNLYAYDNVLHGWRNQRERESNVRVVVVCLLISINEFKSIISIMNCVFSFDKTVIKQENKLAKFIYIYVAIVR